MEGDPGGPSAPTLPLLKKQIVINASKDRSRIAIVEDGELVELYVENPDNVRTIGNVYLGRIQKVMPAIRAAFVDVGQKQDCFLHFSDLTDNFPQLLAIAGEDVPGLDEPVLSLAPAKRVADDDEEPDVEETLEVEPVQEESKTRRSRGRRSRGRGRGRGKGRREEEEEQEEGKRLPGVIDLTSSSSRKTTSKPSARNDESKEEPSEKEAPAEPSEEAPTKRRSRSKKKDDDAGTDAQSATRTSGDGDTSDESSEGDDGASSKRRRRRRSRRGRGDASESNQAEASDSNATDSDGETSAPKTKRPSRAKKKKEETAEADAPGDDDRPSSKRLPSSIDLTSKSQPSPSKRSETKDEDDDSDDGRSRRRSRGGSSKRSDDDGSDSDDTNDDAGSGRGQGRGRGRSSKKNDSADDSTNGDSTRGRRSKSTSDDDSGDRGRRRTRGGSSDDDSNGKDDANGKKDTSGRDSSRSSSSRGGSSRSGSSRGGSSKGPSSGGKIPPNEKLLKRDGRIIVKITKEPISTKGPRVSTDLSLAGRFLVLVPAADYVAVSKKIESAKERRRLRTLAQSLKPDGFGVIVRTVADGRDAKSLDQDLRLLVDKWRKIDKKLREKPEPPVLLYEDVNMVSSIIRDLFSDDYDRILVDDPKVFRNVQAYVKAVAPQMADKVEMHEGRTPVYRSVGIERQVEEAFSKRVNMKGGGYLFIETTEAMHVVDVNSGRAGRGKSQKENLIAVNVEAAREVAKQLRLRDLGGIIVVDFIDLRYDRDRKKVTDALKEAFKKDRAVTKLLPMSDFGLVQITRQRLRPSITTTATDENGEPLDPAEAAAAAGAGEIRRHGQTDPVPEPADEPEEDPSDRGRSSRDDRARDDRPSLAPEDATPQALSGRLRGWLDHYRRSVDDRYKGRPIVVRVHPLFGAYLRRGFPSPLTRWRLGLRGLPFHLEEDAGVDPLAFDVRDQKSGRSLLKKYAA